MADNTNKMLQKVLDGQVAIRKDVKKLESKMDFNFEKVHKRIDKLGLQIASLEDDAPTVEEFDKLEKRVTKVEVKIASI